MFSMSELYKSLTNVKANTEIPFHRCRPVVTQTTKDPVCGMTVDESKAQLKSEHEGRVFYFCSANCKSTFDKDPHRYGH